MGSRSRLVQTLNASAYYSIVWSLRIIFRSNPPIFGQARRLGTRSMDRYRMRVRSKAWNHANAACQALRQIPEMSEWQSSWYVPCGESAEVTMELPSASIILAD